MKPTNGKLHVFCCVILRILYICFMTKLQVHKTFSKKARLVLFNGDCLDLLNQVPDETIKLIVTSPPYNIGKAYEKRADMVDYIGFQKKVIHECVRVLREDGSICWQVGNYVDNGEIIPLDVLLYPIFADLKMKMRNRIVWHFGHGLHASKRFSGRYEVILWFTKSDKYTFNLDAVRVPQKYPDKKHFKGGKAGELSCNPLGKNPSDVWEIPNVKSNHIEKTVHPAQFPVELVERLVLSLTNENDWTLDPFMGVASSQIASIIHNRRSAGSEVMKEYYNLAADRIRLAEDGKLQIRPMERPVFDPSKKNKYVPPKHVNLNKFDLELFERSQTDR